MNNKKLRTHHDHCVETWHTRYVNIPNFKKVKEDLVELIGLQSNKIQPRAFMQKRKVLAISSTLSSNQTTLSVHISIHVFQ